MSKASKQIDISISKDWQMTFAHSIIEEIMAVSPELTLLPVTAIENIVDDIPSFWVSKEQLSLLMQLVRFELHDPFAMCFDLAAIDETERQHKAAHVSDFTVSYHLRSHQRNQDIRIKVALTAKDKTLASV